MKATTELADVLKQACQEVNSWHEWQRSSDPQSSQIDETYTEILYREENDQK
jgi:hypothetical protein